MNTKGEAPRPASKNNPFLNRFLEDNRKPVIKLKETYDEASFILDIDKRYDFKPDIKMAPFSSVGEPWPLPKTYRSELDKVLNLNKETFKILVLNKTCHILTDAIERYKKIIKTFITEEHYEFVYNFDEKTLFDQKRNEKRKYNKVGLMQDLEIDVAEEDCGYPHVDMNESCKLKHLFLFYFFNLISLL